MSNLFRLICSIGFALIVYSSTDAAQSGRIIGQVKFREGPSRSARIIGVLPGGAEVQIIRRDPAGWYLIRYRGQSGFVHEAYVKPQPSRNLPPPSTAKTTKLLILAGMILGGGGIILVIAIFAPFFRRIASLLGGSFITVGLVNL